LAGLTPPLPFTPGQELVGTVTAVGPGVDIAIGTRVLGVSDFLSGNGSFAAEALAQASNVFPAPPGMDDAVAAGFWIPNMTAWIGLVDRGGLKAGQRLAVLGAAGGSGVAAVQLGKAPLMVITTSTPSRMHGGGVYSLHSRTTDTPSPTSPTAERDIRRSISCSRSAATPLCSTVNKHRMPNTLVWQRAS
jgi:D-arabinose 1-dehydrogenase-like Zn-dependent alcohol dehydrogenase